MSRIVLFLFVFFAIVYVVNGKRSFGFGQIYIPGIGGGFGSGGNGGGFGGGFIHGIGGGFGGGGHGGGYGGGHGGRFFRYHG